MLVNGSLSLMSSSSLRFLSRDLIFVSATSVLCCMRVGLVARFNDVAVMCQSIYQRCGHLGVAEHARPFREAEVGRDYDTGVSQGRIVKHVPCKRSCILLLLKRSDSANTLMAGSAPLEFSLGRRTLILRGGCRLAARLKSALYKTCT